MNEDKLEKVTEEVIEIIEENEVVVEEEKEKKKEKPKHLVKVMLVILLVALQCLAFVSHQRMINKRLNKINNYQSEIRMLEIRGGSSFEIENLLNEIDDMKLDIMPIERRLGYIELSFLFYPLVLSLLANSLFNSKGRIKTDAEIWSYVNKESFKKIGRFILDYTLSALFALAIFVFVGYLIVRLIGTGTSYYLCDYDVTMSLEHYDMVLLEVNSSENIKDQIYIRQECVGRISDSEYVVDGYDKTEIGLYRATISFDDESLKDMNLYIKIVDTQKPVITHELEYHLVVQDESDLDFSSVIIEDNSNVLIEAEIIHFIDFNVDGIYPLLIVAEDESGNKSTIQIFVEVRND